MSVPFTCALIWTTLKACTVPRPSRKTGTSFIWAWVVFTGTAGGGGAGLAARASGAVPIIFQATTAAMTALAATMITPRRVIPSFLSSHTPPHGATLRADT